MLLLAGKFFGWLGRRIDGEFRDAVWDRAEALPPRRNTDVQASPPTSDETISSSVYASTPFIEPSEARSIAEQIAFFRCGAALRNWFLRRGGLA